MKKNEFGFKVGYNKRKFNADFWDSGEGINIKFKYYNDKITICQIEDTEAFTIYSEFRNLNIFSMKNFKPEIYKDNIIFTGKAICLGEDNYDKREGEEIALEKALAKRQAFYIMLMDLMKIRLWNIQNESWKIIKQKHKNIWDKKCPEDKQLELPFNNKAKGK